MVGCVNRKCTSIIANLFLLVSCLSKSCFHVLCKRCLKYGLTFFFLIFYRVIWVKLFPIGEIVSFASVKIQSSVNFSVVPVKSVTQKNWMGFQSANLFFCLKRRRLLFCICCFVTEAACLAVPMLSKQNRELFFPAVSFFRVVSRNLGVRF
jgi:hypothetical protein